MKKFGKIWLAVLAAASLLAMPSCKNGAEGDGGTGGDSATIMYRAVEDVATVSTSERAVLSWSKPAENWFGVRIEISPKVEGWGSTKIYKDEMSVLVQGLSAETEYTVTLITVAEEGKDTDKKVTLEFTTPKASDPVIQEVEKPSDTTPAGKVTNLAATAGNAMANLSWTNPTDEDLYGVEVTVSAGTDAKSFVLKKPAAAYAVYGLANGTEYTFSVKSIDTSLNLSEAETATATPADTSDTTAPANVTGLAATSIDTTVTLTWTDATDADIFGYEITYAEAASSRAIAAMTAGSVFVAQGTGAYSATGLTDGKIYTFTVKSVDTSGNKSAGVTANATITDTKEHIHSYVEAWTTDGKHHWHASDCGHAGYFADWEEHDWEWTEDGISKKCSVCDLIYKAELKPGNIDGDTTDCEFRNAIRSAGATLGDDSNVEKIVFALSTDSELKTALEDSDVVFTRRDIGTVDDMYYVYFDARNKTVYITMADEHITKFMFNESCKLLFSGFKKCKEINGLGLCDTSNVTNMSWMFAGDEALTSLDVSNFDTSKVTNMCSMFQGCKGLTSLNLKNFNTSNVTDMSWMFQSCEELTSLNLENFKTSNVADMNWMFAGCKELASLDVSSFDTSKVTNMFGMFAESNVSAALDLRNFNTSNVTNMRYMFGNSKFLALDLSKFNTSNVTDMESMFTWTDVSLDVSSFNTSKVTTMENMFSGCKMTTLDLSNFDTSNVTNMNGMFRWSDSLKTIYVADKDTFVSPAVQATNAFDETHDDYMFRGCGTNELTTKTK